MTSTAALPFVFCSASNGMQAISLQGSKSAYFVLLDAMFCAAPTRTASIRGVVPRAPHNGAQIPGFKTSEKKTQPVANNVTGVTAAATPQPNFFSMRCPASIINNVTPPVVEEKAPMKALYAAGSGNLLFKLAFHVTSTMLMAMP